MVDWGFAKYVLDQFNSIQEGQMALQEDLEKLKGDVAAYQAQIAVHESAQDQAEADAATKADAAVVASASAQANVSALSDQVAQLVAIVDQLVNPPAQPPAEG